MIAIIVEHGEVPAKQRHCMRYLVLGMQLLLQLVDVVPTTRLIRYLEEILGVPAMAAMGRLRRRSSAAVFCAFVCARISPALTDDPGRLARVFALALRSIDEAHLFQVRTPFCSVKYF